MTIASTTTMASALTTAIAANAMKAPSVNLTFSKLFFNRDSIAGLNTMTQRYNVRKALAAAAGGTEGTVITSETHELGLGTAVDITATTGVLTLSKFTEEALGTAFAQLQADVLHRAIQSPDPAVLAAILGDHIEDLTNAGMEKVEKDCLALLSGISNDVGTTATACTINDLISAVFQAAAQKMPAKESRRAFMLSDKQLQDITREAMTTSGGIAGALWNQQAVFNVMNRQADEAADMGYKGEIMGRPVFSYHLDHTVTANAAADSVGFYGAMADINADLQSAMRKREHGFGAILYKTPLNFYWDASGTGGRVVDLTMKSIYGVGELQDANGVAIITRV